MSQPNTVLRWGRSAYESDHALALERQAATALGLDWRLNEDRGDPGDLADVAALVTNSGVRVTEAVLARFAGSLVLTTTSGWDHIDVAAAAARGVAVGRCPMARRDPVVEQALTWLIRLMRREPALDAAALDGRWARGELVGLGGRGVAGSRVLIVGAGVIGRRMGEVLTLLGADVCWSERDGVPVPGERVDLDEALPHVDAVTLHCGLTPSSRSLFTAERLARLPAHAVLVNTARGKVLDVQAAVEAVRSGRLRGLGVDVFPQEPWPAMREAAEVEGVLVAPHAAGYRHDLSERVAREVAAGLGAWHRGEPLPHAV
ncbi:MAG: hydroxyacid dehydrogenase [Deltaproteobacteria bacterium]|nr:MAG: hydroxyacid dehydrogenase [Deltaproteobacteria bacterium]